MNKRMVLKQLFEQVMMVSFWMQMVIAAEELVNLWLEEPFSLQWYIPISVLAVSVICCIPNFILYLDFGRFEWIKVFLHFLCIFGIVMGVGYLFHWYTNRTYALVTAVTVTVGYCLVWMGSVFLNRYDAKMINSVLESIRDDE